MEYQGQELEAFDKAKIFQKYIFFQIKKYFKNGIFEVGAGLGSFSKEYINDYQDIHLSDLDTQNFKTLKKKFSEKKIKISQEKIQDTNLKYNTIVYLNVLEHIKEDTKEINDAESKLNPGGNIIILVPAHQNLYSKFDKAVGHCKRYDIDYFKNINNKKLRIKKLIHLDMFGYFLYFLNKIFFREEEYPSTFKIMVWDKIFIPITILLDFLSFYKFGKNILCVYEKT
tara:strand:+ start:758 stop:1438 length:681 start_codon:yes stop_codon:yes gene_type:complete